eukprot:TRINITY_DN81230_c0_g1_i1.p1 TRINITY_DN81230_c0_g1~~TRINITY_DN81230_c0_g1_i1.p1  ORF type:complete len:464 (-),score=46.84 TRINITY_DN81230_c0_g1_i1:150-1541(-)
MGQQISCKPHGAPGRGNASQKPVISEDGRASLVFSCLAVDPCGQIRLPAFQNACDATTWESIVNIAKDNLHYTIHQDELQGSREDPRAAASAHLMQHLRDTYSHLRFEYVCYWVDWIMVGGRRSLDQKLHHWEHVLSVANPAGPVSCGSGENPFELRRKRAALELAELALAPLEDPRRPVEGRARRSFADPVSTPRMVRRLRRFSFSRLTTPVSVSSYDSASTVSSSSSSSSSSTTTSSGTGNEQGLLLPAANGEPTLLERMLVPLVHQVCPMVDKSAPRAKSKAKAPAEKAQPQEASEGKRKGAPLKWYRINPICDFVYSVRPDAGLRGGLPWERDVNGDLEANDNGTDIRFVRVRDRFRLRRARSVPHGLERRQGLPEPSGMQCDSFRNCCRICYDRPVEVVTLPCRHGGMCEDCLRGTLFSRPAHRGGRQCPFCRMWISEVLRVFRDASITQYAYAIKVG